MAPLQQTQAGPRYTTGSSGGTGRRDGTAPRTRPRRGSKPPTLPPLALITTSPLLLPHAFEAEPPSPVCRLPGLGVGAPLLLSSSAYESDTPPPPPPPSPRRRRSKKRHRASRFREDLDGWDSMEMSPPPPAEFVVGRSEDPAAGKTVVLAGEAGPSVGPSSEERGERAEPHQPQPQPRQQPQLRIRAQLRSELGRRKRRNAYASTTETEEEGDGESEGGGPRRGARFPPRPPRKLFARSRAGDSDVDVDVDVVGDEDDGPEGTYPLRRRQQQQPQSQSQSQRASTTQPRKVLAPAPAFALLSASVSAYVLPGPSRLAPRLVRSSAPSPEPTGPASWLSRRITADIHMPCLHALCAPGGWGGGGGGGAEPDPQPEDIDMDGDGDGDGDAEKEEGDGDDSGSASEDGGVMCWLKTMLRNNKRMISRCRKSPARSPSGRSPIGRRGRSESGSSAGCGERWSAPR